MGCEVTKTCEEEVVKTDWNGGSLDSLVDIDESCGLKVFKKLTLGISIAMLIATILVFAYLGKRLYSKSKQRLPNEARENISRETQANNGGDHPAQDILALA